MMLTCPIHFICFDKGMHERFETLGSCRMKSKQDDARLFERKRALNSDLPEVFIERQHDAPFGFGEVY